MIRIPPTHRQKKVAKEWFRNKVPSCFYGKGQENKCANNVNQLKHTDLKKRFYTRAVKI